MFIDIVELNRKLKSNGCSAAGNVVWFDQIGSTNDYIMALEDPHAAVCIAGLQTKGRGRRGNSWQAPYGSSVLMSMGWRIEPQRVGGLSLACGIAVRRALQELGVENVSLKWPNDLLLGEAKFAGILTEITDKKSVVGLGMNINIVESQPQSPGQTSLPWTDLHREGYNIDFLTLVNRLITELCYTLSHFCKVGFEPFIEEWNRYHNYHLSQVQINGAQTLSGQVKGVDRFGGLIIDTQDGEQTLYSGAISMRPESHHGARS
ncbi:MAG: biotin--[acetyl-CoA-carboxylase] ligase [bacterium]